MASESTILEDILENYTNDRAEWDDVIREGNTDMQVVTGDVWQALDPAGYKQRKEAKRPMLSLDEIGQYINQVVNEVRANPRGMKFAEAGNGASKPGAEFYQNKAREIEYRSHAQLAYTSAFENMVQRGFGYTRVSSKFVHDELFDVNRPPDVSLFNQELWIDAVPDPNMIIPDPYFQRPDLSDQRRCTVLQWRTVADFKRDFKGAKVQSFTQELTAKAPGWFTPDAKRLLVAEAWAKEQVGTRTLLLLKPEPPSLENPQPQQRAVWKEDFEKANRPKSEDIEDDREIPVMQVIQRITNGVEILETHEWAGKHIPITGCFGKMFYLDEGAGAKRKILSMVRLARDPFLLYCYYCTCEMELVGMTPKFPYFVYKGQLDPVNLTNLAKSLHEPVAVIEVDPYVPGLTQTGQPLGFPQRNPFEPPVAPLEMGAEAARRAIQAAMGIAPLPTQAQRQNEKSGAALRQIESSGQKGSFHFLDHYEDLIRQTGVMIEDLITPIYDTARDVNVRKPDGTAAVVRVNDPNVDQPISTAGDYQVTVSAGPSTDSQRQAADDLLDSLVGNLQMVAGLAGPEVAKKMLAESIRNKVQGPSGDLLADLISPPQPEGQQAPSPQLQQAMQQNQQLKQALDQAKQALQADLIKYDAQFKIEDMKASKTAILQLALAHIKAATTIDSAHITAAKEAQTAMEEARNEAIALGLDHAHEMAMTQQDQAHELGMAAVGHDQSMQAADQGHAQALEQGQQGADLAMAQQQAAPMEQPSA